MRKNLQITFGLLIFLAACSASAPAAPTQTLTPEPSLTPTDTPIPPTASPTIPPITPTLTLLSPTSDLESIRQRMLHSFETWHTLWIQISSLARPDAAGTDVRFERMQIWVRQPAELLVIACRYSGDYDPEYYFVSNGTRYLEADLLNRTTREGDVNPVSLTPLVPTAAKPGTIADVPLRKFIPAPAGDMIFPTGLAQLPGTYAPAGEARNINKSRPHVVVDFSPEGMGEIIDRFNVDAFTGILLDWIVLSKLADGTQDELASYQAWPVVVDPEFAPDIFKLEVPSRLHFQEGPEWNVVY